MRAVMVIWTAVIFLGFQQGGLTLDNIVNLSSKNLSSVPKDLPQAVEFLDLSCNNIQQLHRGDFKNITLLKFLNMSWNALEIINPLTFLNTPLLKDLDLSHNHLENLMDQKYLNHTGNLVTLNLAHNRFVAMTLGHEFSSLVKLKRLTIGARNISMGDFKQIAEVKLSALIFSLDNEFRYETGSLTDVHVLRFQICFLKNQKIDHNLISDALSLFDEVELTNMTDGYKDVNELLSQRTEIRTSHLYLSKIQITWKDLTDCVNVVLQRSSLGLTHLWASDVAMTNLPFNDTDVIRTSKMKSFSARRAIVESFFFSQEAIYNFFINMPVESLAITETSIIHMTCPKSQSPIHHLNFSHCALSDTIFSRVEQQKTIECENLNRVLTLTLVGNNLKSLQLLSRRLQYMTSLQDLDLSFNSLIYDGWVECVWPPNITNMTLSSNSLTGSVFNCLPKGTKILNLQNNQISVIPQSLLKLENLSSLNLNSNRLRDLPVCSGFPILHELLLSANSLHAPSVNNLESCLHLKTLDVSHNPFTCTCPLRDFRNLGIRSENHSPAEITLMNWPSDYHCYYPENCRNSTLKDVSITEVSCNVWLLAATILCPTLIVIIVCVSLCHRLDGPWYMNMIWQWTRAKHRARTRHVRPEDLVGVDFHAFVSFSQNNADWVHNFLLPNLEGQAGGLRICHHEKHFLPGKSITQNIISCVERSRRSVFVLSAHFVKSDWCHYELYFASHQGFARGPDSIVLVLLEPLPQYLIPSKYYLLKTMMNKYTYLEWPQDKTKHRLFWANLRAALQTDLPNAPVTEVVN